MSLSNGKRVLQPTADDMQKMLSCQVHLGTRNCDVKMAKYVHARRTDGVHVFNLGRTWEKLMLAARIIVAIENPADVVCASARNYGQRAVLKFSTHVGSNYLAGRYIPGSLTNQIQEKYLEPRLLIVCDPRTDHQPVREASYSNIPVIAFCDTDSPLRHVDVAIPCNNKGKHSIGMMFYLLAREVLRLRGTISRQLTWDVKVDLFFFRDPEEAEKQQAEAAEKYDDFDPAAESYKDTLAAFSGQAAGEWGGAEAQGWESAGGGDWADGGEAAAVPGATF